jgi:hypothetical protein
MSITINDNLPEFNLFREIFNVATSTFVSLKGYFYQKDITTRFVDECKKGEFRYSFSYKDNVVTLFSEDSDIVKMRLREIIVNPGKSGSKQFMKIRIRFETEIISSTKIEKIKNDFSQNINMLNEGENDQFDHCENIIFSSILLMLTQRLLKFSEAKNSYLKRISGGFLKITDVEMKDLSFSELYDRLIGFIKEEIEEKELKTIERISL